MTRLNHVSAKALSETIGAIYDCAIYPEQWPEALRSITELTDSAAAGMGIVDHRLKQSVRLYDYGYQEDDLRIYHEKYGPLDSGRRAKLAPFAASVGIFVQDPQKMPSGRWKPSPGFTGSAAPSCACF